MDYKKRFNPLEVFTDDKWVCASTAGHKRHNNKEGFKEKVGVPIYLPSDQ